eukprot:8126202-Pyramimonas_sp.AAC.1
MARRVSTPRGRLSRLLREPSIYNGQVYMNYGDKTNSELLLDYGFVDTSVQSMEVGRHDRRVGGHSLVCIQ